MWLRDKMYLLFLGDNACDIVQLLYKLTDMTVPRETSHWFFSNVICLKYAFQSVLCQPLRR